MADSHMQSLATELGIAETAFVTPGGRTPDTFGLRWFSPATEIDLCGHATLASAHVLRQRGVVDGAEAGAPSRPAAGRWSPPSTATAYPSTSRPRP